MQRWPSPSRDLLTLTLCICLTLEHSFNPLFSLMLSPSTPTLSPQHRGNHTITHTCTLGQTFFFFCAFIHAWMYMHNTHTQTDIHTDTHGRVHMRTIFFPHACFSLYSNSIRKIVAWSKQDMTQRQMRCKNSVILHKPQCSGWIWMALRSILYLSKTSGHYHFREQIHQLATQTYVHEHFMNFILFIYRAIDKIADLPYNPKQKPCCIPIW